MDLDNELTSLFFVIMLAAAAPILVGLIRGSRIPQVVILLFGGILIGPEGLGLADENTLDLLSQVGLGFLFLLAGYEIDLNLLRQPVMRRAGAAWVVAVRSRSPSLGRSRQWGWFPLSFPSRSG